MWLLERDEPDYMHAALPFVLGALGGLAVGLVIAGRGSRRPLQRLGSDLRERARSAGSGPSQQYRLVGEQAELTRLEDAVLDAFLEDELLSGRGIDVGALGRGIVELSGSVWTEEEADRAVHVAQRIQGVVTVVDRMELEEEVRHLAENRRRLANQDPSLSESQWEGRTSGMGRMRQGAETEPDRPDDSQHMTERALRRADIDEWGREDLAAKNSNTTVRPEDPRPGKQPDFRPDELDNQSPYQDGGPYTMDRQPQQTNPDARVGDGLKPGVERLLEEADLPVDANPGDGTP